VLVMEPTVKDVMTTTVVAVKQGASYKEMAALLRNYRVSAFPVTVADGVVAVTGAPETADLGHRIVDKIRHVQGVVAVHDKLGDPPAEASFADLHF
jgi:CBS domain-containing protein